MLEIQNLGTIFIEDGQLHFKGNRLESDHPDFYGLEEIRFSDISDGEKLIEASTKEKDYKTLVKLDAIEKPIMDLLKKNGIADSCIHFSYMNTSYSWYYYEEKKPVRFEKTLAVKLHDFDKAVAIVQQLDTKGITYLTLGDFKSSKEQQMRKDLKAQALKNAQDKAQMMLSKVDKTIGEIVSVKEVNDDENARWSWQPSQSSMSNSTYSSSNAQPAGSPQDIKMRYQVEAEFLIE